MALHQPILWLNNDNNKKTVLMKTKFLIIFSILLIISCRNNDDNENSIIGTWKLSAQLADPGDGSGTFQAVSNNRTVTFYRNGTYSSNGNFCTMNSDSNETTTGSYSFTNTEKSLTPNCNNSIIKLKLNIENNQLTMTNFGCYESCAQKYVKLNN